MSGRELFQIRNIERYTNTRIQRARIPTEAEVEEARENVFLDKLRAMLKSGEFKRQDQLIERLLEEGFTSTDIASACLAQLQSGEAAPATPPRAAEYDRRAPNARSAAFRCGPRPFVRRGGREQPRSRKAIALRWIRRTPARRAPKPLPCAFAG